MPRRLPCSLPPLASAVLLLLVLLAAPALASGATQIKTYRLPEEVRSTHYRVRINGKNADVLHAATGYYLLNFDIDGPVTVSVTAEDPYFWDRGVEIQPMRLGIRPVRKGATITFPLRGSQKLTIARPGDHFADADMLFLFANVREEAPNRVENSSLRYIGPGVHHENIDAKSGDRIYLDGGAVVFGALNVWQVKDVHVSGRGTIIYDGPQDPHSDEGWMHRPNWHCIVMDQAENIEIDGITCITRSRSWQIQMKDSHHIGFYNLKAIGGNSNDANQDGLDWLGGGETTVRNSFFRASDDVFALQGNWEGYDPELLKRPGHDVTNITIDDTVASTSVSNTIRVGWPQKTFNSAHFHMSNMDVIHTGFGGCKVPFAFFELWADPDGHGRHEDYSFRNIRLEEWYSLFQVRQPEPSVRNISFSGVWAMDGPAMNPSVVLGDIGGLSLDDASLQGFASAAPEVREGAQSPVQERSVLDSGFSYTSGLLKSGERITFNAAEQKIPHVDFEWIFGDGSRAHGPAVTHLFPDDEGTLLDGSGRYRVLLHLIAASGAEAWSSQSVVLAKSERHPRRAAVTKDAPGGQENHVDRWGVDIPADGGYSFTLLTSTKGSLAIDDGAPVSTPLGRPQVCGSQGNAVQPVRLYAALRKGRHQLVVTRDASLENATSFPANASGSPMVLWEGPALPRQVLTPATGTLLSNTPDGESR